MCTLAKLRLPQGIELHFQAEGRTNIVIAVSLVDVFRQWWASFGATKVLLLPLEPAPAVGAELTIEIMLLADAQRALFSGRVIQHTPQGVAVDLSRLSESDQAALRVLLGQPPAPKITGANHSNSSDLKTRPIPPPPQASSTRPSKRSGTTPMLKKSSARVKAKRSGVRKRPLRDRPQPNREDRPRRTAAGRLPTSQDRPLKDDDKLKRVSDPTVSGVRRKKKKLPRPLGPAPQHLLKGMRRRPASKDSSDPQPKRSKPTQASSKPKASSKTMKPARSSSYERPDLETTSRVTAPRQLAPVDPKVFTAQVESSGPRTTAARINALKSLTKGTPELNVPILSEGPLSRLLHISARGEDGIAVIYDGRLNSMVVFKEGVLVDVQVTPMSDKASLGDLLLNAEVLDEARYKRLRALTETKGVDDAQGLIDETLMDRGEAEWASVSRLSHLVKMFCRSRRGSITYFPVSGGLPYETGFPPIYLPWVMYQELAQQPAAITSAARKADDARKRHFPVRVEPPPFDLSEVASLGREIQWTMSMRRLKMAREMTPELYPFFPRYLTDKHLELYQSLDGMTRLSAVIKQSTLTPNPATEALVVFQRLGLITFEEKSPVNMGDSDRILIEAIEGRMRQIADTDDPFKILQIHWSDPERVVSRCFRACAVRFLPENFSPAVQKSHKEHLSAIREKLENAKEELSTRERRELARQEFVDPQAIKDFVLQSVLLSEVEIWQNNYDQAMAFAVRSLEVDPEHEIARKQLNLIAALKSRATSKRPASEDSEIDLRNSPLGIAIKRRTRVGHGFDDAEMKVILRLMKAAANGMV